MAILLLIMLVLFPQDKFNSSSTKTEWLVTSGSSLTIAGTTNINEFACMNLTYDGKDVLLETRDPRTDKSIISGLVFLKAKSFDCENRIMTQDMQKTIQAQKFPNIKVHFLSLQRDLGAGKKNQKVKGLVEVCLAGVSRQYEIEAVFQDGAAGKANLVGSWQFSFSDFNIEPPTRLGGAIKVRNKLTVNFNLELQELQGKQTLIGNL